MASALIALHGLSEWTEMHTYLRESAFFEGSPNEDARAYVTRCFVNQQSMVVQD